ncbi:MAG: hypothetical protein AB8B63_09515 [Granulosicoccus sp.]
MNETSNSEIDNDKVTAALNAILGTDKFSASPQMSAFLKYVVEQTLLGNTRRIKAFTVGIEALGKSSSFDPQTDPSVRVLAKRLRSSLDAYYEKNPNTPIYIEMKPGSYIPKFLLRSEMQSAMDLPAATTSYQPASTPSIPAAAHQPMPQAATTTANPATSGSTAHVNVPQQSSLANTAAEEKELEASATETAEEATQKPDITKLWQSYKSPSKVA